MKDRTIILKPVSLTRLNLEIVSIYDDTDIDLTFNDIDDLIKLLMDYKRVMLEELLEREEEE